MSPQSSHAVGGAAGWNAHYGRHWPSRWQRRLVSTGQGTSAGPHPAVLSARASRRGLCIHRRSSGPPAITPDGSMIAFCAHNQKERSSLWVQPLGELTAKKLEDTEGASFPFWSPDGKFIGFFAEGHLKKVPSAGGPVTILADAANARGGSWSQENVIIYEPDYRDSLWEDQASGDSGAADETSILGESHHSSVAGFSARRQAFPVLRDQSLRRIRTGNLHGESEKRYVQTCN